MAESSSPPMPFWALLLSIAVFAVPAVLTGLHPAPSPVVGISWLFVVVPVFFFGYFEEWRGVALAQAIWFTLLALSVMAGLLLSSTPPDWQFLAVMSVALMVISLAVGWLSYSLRRDVNVTAQRERTMVEQLALRDELTTLPNSKYVRLYLESSFAAAQRGYPLTLVMLDVDRLGEYNGYHGHGAGDAALRAIGHVLRRTTRKMEVSARLESDRFLTLLATREAGAAIKFVRRVRHSLLEVDLPRGKVTISAGIAPFDVNMKSAEDMIAAARAALGRAKTRGREQDAVYETDGLDPARAPLPSR